jgi:hypothetical protein
LSLSFYPLFQRAATAGIRRPRPFNGATVLRPWKCTGPGQTILYERKLQWSHRLWTVEMLKLPPKKPWAWRLQWSHRLATVEMGLPRGAAGPVPPASMEPQSLDRGNGASGATPAPAPSGFNGATALRLWKWRTSSYASCVTMLAFNGATALRPWKSSAQPTRPEILVLPSMEPQSLDRGKAKLSKTIFTQGASLLSSHVNWCRGRPAGR